MNYNRFTKKNIALAILIVFVTLLALFIYKDHVYSKLSFDEKLNELNAIGAVFSPKPYVEDKPYWSSSDDSVALSVGGEWKHVDILNSYLGKSKWQDRILGFSDNPVMSNIDDIKVWTKGKYKEMPQPNKEIITSIFEAKIEYSEMGMIFKFAPKGRSPRVLFQTVFEQCGHLGISQSEKYISFICDSNGFIVLSVDKIVQQYETMDKFESQIDYGKIWDEQVAPKLQ